MVGQRACLRIERSAYGLAGLRWFPGTRPKIDGDKNYYREEKASEMRQWRQGGRKGGLGSGR